MRSYTLAHLSDLHLGLSAATTQHAASLCATLVDAGVDHVVVSGDLTHRGLRKELALFHEVFQPLLRSGRMTLVPGNHDRLGEDAGAGIMDGARVTLTETAGLYLVAVDSTGPHNRSLLDAEGLLTAADLDEIDRLLAAAPARALRVVALHHHPLPLPEDSFSERLLSRIAVRTGSELARGPDLVRRLYGRCDLLLHGHRHHPSELDLFLDDRSRPLAIFNAGSSSQLGRSRVFTHASGRVTASPFWLSTDPGFGRPPPRPMGIFSAVRALGLF
jgi:3',5'-cyclic AMP phosphodiesterase CpdA